MYLSPIPQDFLRWKCQSFPKHPILAPFLFKFISFYFPLHVTSGVFVQFQHLNPLSLKNRLFPLFEVAAAHKFVSLFKTVSPVCSVFPLKSCLPKLWSILTILPVSSGGHSWFEMQCTKLSSCSSIFLNLWGKIYFVHLISSTSAVKLF